MALPAGARDRIVFVALPDTLGPATMQRWQNNVVAALNAGMEAGVAAVVVILDPGFNPAPIQMLTAMTAQQSAPVPVFGVLHSALAPVFTAAGLDLAALRATEPASPVPVPVAFSLRTASGRTPVAVPNVVGILPGSDPALRNEYVVFSAHMDHVGVGPAVNGDSIFNGADDDASGTTAVLEVAQAFAAAAAKPKRSLIFLLVSGEEKGLLGSRHFAANPPVPLERIVANINLDMVGRNHPDTVVAIGQEYSDLGATVQQVAQRHERELELKVAPDLWPQENLFMRSDHFSFASRGVPAIFFTTGLHEDYHKQSDEPGTIDHDKLARIARLIHQFGAEVANSAARPQWTAAGKTRLRLE
jgi:Zn-dependent M28 family amino/carboxypeptidase